MDVMDLLLRRRELMMGGKSSTGDQYIYQPFTIIAKKSIYVYLADGLPDNGTGPSLSDVEWLKYNINNTRWIQKSIDHSSASFTGITLNAGDKMQLIGKGAWSNSVNPGYVLSIDYINDENGSCVDIEGNLMSLIGGDDFVNCDTIPDYCFYSGTLDWYNENCVANISNLRISATTIGDYALYGLFENQKNLYGDVENLIPATNIGAYCYQRMFRYCESLTSAPALPALTLADGCYYSMFQYCTRLERAPELPALTLVKDCYRTMFSRCSNLNYIKAMFTTTPSTTYTRNWVQYTPSTGTFVKNSSATWNVTGTYGIPSGWTVQTANS